MSNLVAARPTAGAGLLLGALLLALGPGLSAPSYAAPESTTEIVREVVSPQEKALERQVDRREQALSQMFAVAERHARVKKVRADRLRALGYTGDLTRLTHVLPVHGYHLSAGFGAAGPLWKADHTGLDFGAPFGAELVAVGDATVTEVADAGAYGLRTILTLENGTQLWYCHQLSAVVVPGQVVEVGEVIGLVGSSGNSTGPHLHFEVRPEGGAATDPVPWLEALGLAP